MNNDLAGETAVWRALFGGAQSPLLLLICVFVILIFKLIFKEPPKCFAADDGSGSEDGRSSRCCTLGELLQECDLVSVMAVQEKCDGKRTGAEVGFLATAVPPATRQFAQHFHTVRRPTLRGFSQRRQNAVVPPD